MRCSSTGQPVLATGGRRGEGDMQESEVNPMRLLDQQARARIMFRAMRKMLTTLERQR